MEKGSQAQMWSGCVPSHMDTASGKETLTVLRRDLSDEGSAVFLCVPLTEPALAFIQS